MDENGTPSGDQVVVSDDNAGVIKRLPQDVVNKIAAGEIIQRPANALKEMMENSLDAGAHMIRIQLRDGGTKMLQIQDDGKGVALVDLPLLCERFATSKLRSFEDLSRMTTFGFRGEALASVSYVSATMAVVSRAQDSQVAYRAFYASGALTPPKPGQDPAPRPCAGSVGTTITVDDLFYNMPQRRRALKSATEEYAIVLDIVSKYAVHFASEGVGFTCKKAGSGSMDISVPASPPLSTLEAISTIYGTSLSKQLIALPEHKSEEYQVTFCGFMSSPGWSSKRVMFTLFINNRLVDCPPLRRALLSLYSTILPKGSHPWIYLRLDMNPSIVDVNVHPTKREVHFLREDEIIELICVQAQEALAHTNTSRSFTATQVPLVEPEANAQKAAPQAPKPISYPKNMIRVDGKARTLDSMGIFSQTIPSITPQQEESLSAGSENDAEENAHLCSWDEQGARSTQKHSDKIQDHPNSQLLSEDVPITDSEDEFQTNADSSDDALSPVNKTITTQTPSQKLIPQSKVDLASVDRLRQAVLDNEYEVLRDIFRDHVFVGIVDTERALSMLQHRTKLYMIQYASVLQELSYQLLLRQFASLPALQLSPPPLLRDLVRLALDTEPLASQKRRSALGLSDQEVVDRVEAKLVMHKDMLFEYFSIGISNDKTISSAAQLTTLPDIFGCYSTKAQHSTPVIQLVSIPNLILRLATQVDYSNEESCFKSILSELALAHVPIPSSGDDVKNQQEHQWRAIWTDALRYYAPSRHLSRSGAVTSVANLPSLYSVFERC